MGWLEVVLVNVAHQMAWNVQMVFEEGAIDYQLRLIIGNLARPPGFDLPAQRLEVPLNSINADG